MKRMAVISAGFVPVPAVDGGAGEVLTTELIKGNEKKGDYYMDIYTIESPKLNSIMYNNAEIIQIHITKWNRFFCKSRNFFLKLIKKKYRFIPYNRALLKKFRDNYDIILIENNMQVYEDIYNHFPQGENNMVYHMHNDIDGTTKPESLCRMIADTAKMILPVSEYLANHFNDVAPNNKTKVFYNCVDTDIFDKDKEYNKEELRKKYGISKSDFVYVYTGRICPEKGVLELVKAFKELEQEQHNIKLLVVGSRWYNLIEKDEYFKQLIEETKTIENKVLFTGYVYPEDMPSIYSMGDALVIPSMWEEPFGVVALEGMAMCKPIIATDSGGLTEILEDKITATIVHRDKMIVKRIKDAMKELLVDIHYRESIVYNAYVHLCNHNEFQAKYYYESFYRFLNNN